MKILQVVQKPQRRGAEVFAYELSEELSRRGAAVRTVYLYGDGGAATLPRRPGDVALSGDERSGLEKLPGIHPAVVRGLSRAIRDFRPDLVQANGSRTVKYSALAKAIDPTRRWKLVYRNIGLASHWQRSSRTLWGYRMAVVPQIDGVVCVTAFSMADAVALYKLRVPTVVIRNGFDPKKLECEAGGADTGESLATARLPTDFVLLFLGTLSPEKGPDRFVRILAAAAAREKNGRRFRGWFVGDGPMRTEIENLTADLASPTAASSSDTSRGLPGFSSGPMCWSSPARPKGCPRPRWKRAIPVSRWSRRSSGASPSASRTASRDCS